MMDPLSRAQELHTKLREESLAKSKRIQSLERELSQLKSQLTDVRRAAEEEKKKAEKQVEEHVERFVQRAAELDEREQSLQQQQDALSAAQEELRKAEERASAAVEQAESKARASEEARFAAERERDATLAENVAQAQKYHEQLVSLSTNYLSAQTEDVERLNAAKKEIEQLKERLVVQNNDRIVSLEREVSSLKSDYESKLASLKSSLDESRRQHAEDEQRWNEQKKELTAMVERAHNDLEESRTRLVNSSKQELERLQSLIVEDSRKLVELEKWQERRAENDAKLMQAREEVVAVRAELESSIRRYEQLESTSSHQLNSLRSELEHAKKVLNETQMNLTKKTAALQVFHRQIAENKKRLEEMEKAAHRQKEEQERLASQHHAGSGRHSNAGQKVSGQSGGFGEVLSSFFKGDKDRDRKPQQQLMDERDRDAVLVAAAQHEIRRRKSSNAGQPPTQTMLSGVDEQLACDLSEEMAVALSKRVEQLEDQRLELTNELERYKKRYEQEHMINRLHQHNQVMTSGGGMRATTTSPEAASTGSASASDAPQSKKKSLFGSILSGVKRDLASSQRDPLADPARVRQLLEEQLLMNQQLENERERDKNEIGRLKHLLAAAKDEAKKYEEVRRQEKTAAALSMEVGHTPKKVKAGESAGEKKEAEESDSANTEQQPPSSPVSNTNTDPSSSTLDTRETSSSVTPSRDTTQTTATDHASQ